jgi:hypothetical protein
MRITIFPLISLFIHGRKIDECPFEMDFISIRLYEGLDFLEDMRVFIMENKNSSILIHVFFYKTKYPIHIIIYVMVPRGYNSGRYGDKRH